MNHRTSLVAALSVVGVVLAGTAAVAANVGILDASPEFQDVSAVADVSGASSSSSSTSTTQPEQNRDEVSYQIPGVAVINLIRQGSAVEVSSVSSDGWQAVESTSGDTLRIDFVSGDRLIEFRAEVEDGQVVVDVVETSLAATTSQATTTTQSTGDGVVAVTLPPAPTTSIQGDHEEHDDDSDWDDSDWDDDSERDDEVDRDDDHESEQRSGSSHDDDDHDEYEDD